jgi:hypothetical protein
MKSIKLKDGDYPLAESIDEHLNNLILYGTSAIKLDKCSICSDGSECLCQELDNLKAKQEKN